MKRLRKKLFVEVQPITLKVSGTCEWMVSLRNGVRKALRRFRQKLCQLPVESMATDLPHFADFTIGMTDFAGCADRIVSFRIQQSLCIRTAGSPLEAWVQTNRQDQNQLSSVVCQSLKSQTFPQTQTSPE